MFVEGEAFMSFMMNEDTNRRPDPNMLMPEDKKSSEKSYPKYDDVMHIDSSACAERPDSPRGQEPYIDPKTTEYTEKYCGDATN